MDVPARDLNSFHLDSQDAGASSPVIPRTPVERAIYGIWTSFLNRERIGLQEDFFALGGTPELAEQVAEEVRQIFLLELSTARLFASPGVAGQAAAVEEARQAARKPEQSIPQAPRSPHMPLSFSQQRLWFFDLLVPGSALYNNGLAAEITGPLNAEALEKSLNEIIRRHEALRTTFVMVEGQPFQRVHPEWQIQMPCLDLQSLPPAGRQAETSRLITEEGLLPFDLSNGPLIRARLLQLGPNHYYLLLSIHHIVSDGWSMGVLVRELTALYTAFHAGRPSPLLRLPIQYIEFACWQRQRLQGAFLETHLGYWREKLKNLPPAPDLPVGRPRPDTFSFRGASYNFQLPGRLVQALHLFSERHDVTLFMTLLAAFAVLLHRYNNSEDFCIGTPTANRSRAELEGLIGLFINMLVLRADLTGSPAFEEFLQRIKKTTLDAFAHQDIPFELLVEKLRPKRDSNRNPFFQVLFVFANFKMQPLQLTGLDTRLTDIDTHTAKFDLSLYVIEQAAGGLTCKLEYCTDLFDPQTIEQMANQFQELLAEIVRDPGQRILYMVEERAAGHDQQPDSIDRNDMSIDASGDREDFEL